MIEAEFSHIVLLVSGEITCISGALQSQLGASYIWTGWALARVNPLCFTQLSPAIYTRILMAKAEE